MTKYLWLFFIVDWYGNHISGGFNTSKEAMDFANTSDSSLYDDFWEVVND